MLASALNTAAPWDSIIDFVTHPSFCDFPIYPKQATLLKLIFLETENFTAFDLATIDDWRKGMMLSRDCYGIQPDIWQRIDYLKARGYRRFPHIQMVVGRRAGKGLIGGALGCEQIAYLHSLDNPQVRYGIQEGKDVFMNVGGTSQTMAMRQLFADIRTMVERCKYFRPSGRPPWIAESKDHIFRIRTPADLRRIAELKAARIPIDHQIASLVAVALSASSVAGRGATAYCLDPETPVLTADLRWVPIRSLAVGDEVVGVDEEPPGEKSDGRRLQRKLRVAEVQGKTTTIKRAYRLRFADGTHVVCSADHRWLTRSKSTGALIWRTTVGRSAFHSIKAGDQISRIVTPWGEDDSREAGYLAGVYDGEGSLYSGSGLSVMFSQNPGLVLDETLALLKEKGFHPQPNNVHAYGEPGVKQCQQWAIRGLAEGLRFLGQIRPQRLLAKAANNYEGVAIRGKGSERYSQPDHFSVVVSVEELPEQELVDIQTSTGTFVANGLVSHNCNMFDEFAFHVQTGSVKSDSQIYKDWQPSLGQFGQDSLTYIPSSPATKIGEFYALYQRALVMMSNYNDNSGRSDEARETLVQNGVTIELDAEPTWLLYQGPSWSLYEDWQHTQKILGLGYIFPKAPEPDLTDERQMRERRRDPQKFKVEKQGQFSEVQGAYLDEDKVNKMFVRPHTLDPETGEKLYWREPLTAQPYGTFDKTYRMHCDPGLTGANFAMCIGHLEDAPPDQYGIVWPHVIIDLLHVWRPMDFPEDPETKKQTIDYVRVHNDLDVTIGKYRSLDRVSFDQWQSASFISSLRQKYSPGIHVSEVTFAEKENQSRMEKFKSALNLEWVHSYVDNFYVDDLSCLLELELKFLSVAPNGKVVKQDIGPVTTKDLADCLMVVTVDLLGDALDRYSDERMNARAFGSSNAAALRSGRELDRMMEAGINTRVAEQMAAQAAERQRAQLQGRGGRAQGPSRLSSIHARADRNNRRQR
jgi:hypothetical protein